jgi:hypothetical protein
MIIRIFISASRSADNAPFNTPVKIRRSGAGRNLVQWKHSTATRGTNLKGMLDKTAGFWPAPE